MLQVSRRSIAGQLGCFWNITRRYTLVPSLQVAMEDMLLVPTYSISRISGGCTCNIASARVLSVAYSRARGTTAAQRWLTVDIVTRHNDKVQSKALSNAMWLEAWACLVLMGR